MLAATCVARFFDMPRIARMAPGKLIYHVLNRGNDRQDLFHADADADAAAFIRVLKEAKTLIPFSS